MSRITWGVDGYGHRHYLCHDCEEVFGIVDRDEIKHDCTTMATSTRKQISQPPDWWTAFEAQAERDGYTGVSEWLGAVGVANLDKDLAKGLPERVGRGKPPKPKKGKSH